MEEAHKHTSLTYLADNDLANRSKAAGLVYLALFLIIVAFTPFYSEHPAVVIPAGFGIVAFVLLRTWLTLGFEARYSRHPEHWIALFTLSTLVIAGIWGSMCAYAVHFYALEWTAMLTLLSTAGISAGAITTLSIRRHLVLVFLSLLLLPPIAAAAAMQTREAAAITLMFLTYFVFMFGVANRINKEYWKALKNAALLDQRARELEASNQELESYSYSIAHDLRTPLRSIIGFSQILLEDAREKCSATDRSHLQRVVNAGKHMAQLIDDILELSRITRKDMENSRTNLSELAGRHTRLLASQQPERSVSVRIEPGLVTDGDTNLLAIALQNLLDNAWKFTARTTHAEISFYANRDNGETVYCICDNGVGFDMSYAEKLFKPFHRLHNEADFPGTGVGLATVQRIILRHGGQIWAEGGVGKGACFYFTLQENSPDNT